MPDGGDEGGDEGGDGDTAAPGW